MKDLFAKPIPIEWYRESVGTSFSISYNGEGTYYCPSCGEAVGDIWRGDDPPLKADSICYTCEPLFLENEKGKLYREDNFNEDSYRVC